MLYQDAICFNDTTPYYMENRHFALKKTVQYLSLKNGLEKIVADLLSSCCRCSSLLTGRTRPDNGFCHVVIRWVWSI